VKKKFVIAGNWKMFKTSAESRRFVADLDRIVPAADGIDVVLFIPFTSLEAVKGVSDKIRIGAQNMFYEREGAFTGEISPLMLQGLADSVLIGHSERREIFGETDDMIRKKLPAALAVGLKPLLCIGETLAERDQGKTVAKIEGQLESDLAGLEKDDIRKLAIAYEPVWAIGTGRNATPAQAQEVHSFIRGWLDAKLGDASRFPLLYGGSVKPENSGDLLSQPDIDGVLVGGASLKVESFSAIITHSLNLLEK